jgi:hypothetical protein
MIDQKSLREYPPLCEKFNITSLENVKINTFSDAQRYDICDKSLSGSCDRSVVFSTNKTDLHDITEILLKVALNTIKQTNRRTDPV